MFTCVSASVYMHVSFEMLSHGHSMAKAKQEFQDEFPNVTMHHVNGRILQPLCEQFHKCYAHIVNDQDGRWQISETYGGNHEKTAVPSYSWRCCLSRDSKALTLESLVEFQQIHLRARDHGGLSGVIFYFLASLLINRSSDSFPPVRSTCSFMLVHSTGVCFQSAVNYGHTHLGTPVAPSLTVSRIPSQCRHFFAAGRSPVCVQISRSIFLTMASQ